MSTRNLVAARLGNRIFNPLDAEFLVNETILRFCISIVMHRVVRLSAMSRPVIMIRVFHIGILH